MSFTCNVTSEHISVTHITCRLRAPDGSHQLNGGLVGSAAWLLPSLHFDEATHGPVIWQGKELSQCDHLRVICPFAP
jgi:hypothetical protein